MHYIKDLYVGRIGTIYAKSRWEKYRRKVKETNDYIIFTIENDKGKEIGIDVLTGRKFFVWANLSFDDVKKLIGYKVITDYELIDKYIKKYLSIDELTQRTITTEQIIKLYNIINKITIIVNPKNKNSNPVDLVLRFVLELQKIISDSNIESDIKSTYFKIVNKIAYNYTNEMLDFLNNKFKTEDKNEITELSIKEKYLRELLSFEIEIKRSIEKYDYNCELKYYLSTFKNK